MSTNFAGVPCSTGLWDCISITPPENNRVDVGASGTAKFEFEWAGDGIGSDSFALGVEPIGTGVALDKWYQAYLDIDGRGTALPTPVDMENSSFSDDRVWAVPNVKGDTKITKISVSIPFHVLDTAVPAKSGYGIKVAVVPKDDLLEKGFSTTVNPAWSSFFEVRKSVDLTGSVTCDMDGQGDLHERSNEQEGKHYVQRGDVISLSNGEFLGSRQANIGVDQVEWRWVSVDDQGDPTHTIASTGPVTWSWNPDDAGHGDPDFNLGQAFSFDFTPEEPGGVLDDVDAAVDEAIASGQLRLQLRVYDVSDGERLMGSSEITTYDVVAPNLALSGSVLPNPANAGDTVRVTYRLENRQVGSEAKGLTFYETLASGLGADVNLSYGADGASSATLSGGADAATRNAALANESLIAGNPWTITHEVTLDSGVKADSELGIEAWIRDNLSGGAADERAAECAISIHVASPEKPGNVFYGVYGMDSEGPLPLDGITQSGELVSFIGDISFAAGDVPETFEVTGVAPDGCSLDAVTVWGGHAETFTDGDSFRVVFSPEGQADFSVEAVCLVGNGVKAGSTLTLPMRLAYADGGFDIPPVLSDDVNAGIYRSINVVASKPVIDVTATVDGREDASWLSPGDVLTLAYDIYDATENAYMTDVTATVAVPDWLENVSVEDGGLVTGEASWDPDTRVASLYTSDVVASAEASAKLVVKGIVSKAIDAGSANLTATLFSGDVRADEASVSFELARPRVSVSVDNGGSLVIQQGDEATYGVSVANVVAGTTAENVSVEVPVPEGLQVVDAGGLSTRARVLSFEVPSLPYGQTESRNFTLMADSSYVGPAESEATAFVDNVAASSAKTVSLIAADESVGIGLWSDANVVAPSASVPMTLVFSSNDAAITSVGDISVTLDLPEGFIMDMDSVTSVEGGDAPGIAIDGIRVTLSGIALSAGTPYVIHFNATAPSNPVDAATFKATSTYSGAATFAVEAETTISVAEPTWNVSSEFALPNTAERPALYDDDTFAVSPGEEVLLNVTLTNSYGVGADSLTAKDIQLSTLIPSGFKVGSSAPTYAWVSNPEGSAMDDVNVSYDAETASYSMSVASLEEGETIVFSLPVVADGDWLGETVGFRTSAMARGGASTAEVVSEASPYPPMFHIEKMTDRETAEVGDEVTYEVDVWQTTPRTSAKNVVVVDTLPEAMSFVGTPSCDYPGSSVSVGEDGRTLTVKCPELTDGIPLAVVYRTRIEEGAQFPLENYAEATADNVAASEAVIRPIKALEAHTAHEWGEWEVEESPTCTTEGWSKRSCEVCGTPEEARLDPAGHKIAEEDRVEKEPTCTEAGSTAHVVYCERCGEIISSESKATSPLGHEFKDGVCTRCGIPEHPSEEHVHDWGEWVMVTEPTCTASGVAKRFCKGCSEVEEKGLDALGHNFVDGVCTRCGLVEGAPEPPTATFEPGSAKAGDEVALKVQWPVEASDGAQVLSIDLGGLELAGDIIWKGDGDITWAVDDGCLIISLPASATVQTIALDIPLAVPANASFPIEVSVGSASGDIRVTLNESAATDEPAGDEPSGDDKPSGDDTPSGDTPFGGTPSGDAPSGEVPSGDPSVSPGVQAPIVYGFDYNTMQPVITSKVPDTGVPAMGFAFGAIAAATGTVLIVRMRSSKRRDG